MTECQNTAHDHTAFDDNGSPIDGQTATCADCGAPSHWDENVQWHLHDDPHAPECFLKGNWPINATLCTRPMTTLQVCSDCALILANDDDSGIDDPIAHRAAMARHLSGLDVAVTGDCTYFSWTPCDGCGSPLGGDRMHAIAYDNNN